VDLGFVSAHYAGLERQRLRLPQKEEKLKRLKLDIAAVDAAEWPAIIARKEQQLAAIKAKFEELQAKGIRKPDKVGYQLPKQYDELVRKLQKHEARISNELDLIRRSLYSHYRDALQRRIASCERSIARLRDNSDAVEFLSLITPAIIRLNDLERADAKVPWCVKRLWKKLASSSTSTVDGQAQADGQAPSGTSLRRAALSTGLLPPPPFHIIGRDTTSTSAVVAANAALNTVFVQTSFPAAADGQTADDSGPSGTSTGPGPGGSAGAGSGSGSGAGSGLGAVGIAGRPASRSFLVPRKRKATLNADTAAEVTRIKHVVQNQSTELPDLNPVKDMCSNCHMQTAWVNDSKNATRSCQRCGSIDANHMSLVAENWQSEHEYKNSQPFTYERRAHFIDCLRQRQAKERKDIRTSLLQDICRELCLKKMFDPVQIRVHHIHAILKKLGESAFFDHEVLIWKMITRNQPPRLTDTQEDILIRMFDQTLEPFNKHKGERNNYLTYTYAIHKLMELLGYSEDVLEFYPVLRSANKLESQESIWRLICQDLGWPFYKTRGVRIH
jgi:hypothetical protein